MLETSLGPAARKTTHRFGRASPQHGRMAAENRLWGAPRIHGELLKLGIAVSERTVSRYLADIRVAPSQTWRTFLANHFGQLSFSPVMLWGALDEDNGVDVSGVSLRPASALGEQSCVSDQWSVVHWPLPRERTSVDGRIARAHVHHRTREYPSSGKDPPRTCACDSHGSGSIGETQLSR